MPSKLQAARSEFCKTYLFKIGRISGCKKPFLRRIQAVYDSFSVSEDEASLFGCHFNERALLVEFSVPHTNGVNMKNELILNSIVTFPRMFKGYPVYYRLITKPT